MFQVPLFDLFDFMSLTEKQNLINQNPENPFSQACLFALLARPSRTPIAQGAQ